MKTFISVIFVILSAYAQAAIFSIENSLKDKVTFVSHETPGQWSSYLAMNIKFEPVKTLFNSLDERLSGTLNKQNARTEAHITVITPVEFHNVLRDKVSISEVHKIAQAMQIQNSEFEIVCLGRGEAMVDQQLEQTYYLVVNSPRLLQIREAVFNLYKSRGGKPNLFDPELFYPHITIGYTKDDLHLGSHGVIKGKNSCFADIEVQ